MTADALIRFTAAEQAAALAAGEISSRELTQAHLERIAAVDRAVHAFLDVDAAKALFRDAPEVQQCYYVTGGISFVVIIVCTDMVTYEAVTRRLFAQNDAVASFRSLIALDRVKAATEIVITDL